MKRIIGRISFLFILILSLGLISCDSWMTGDNFFDQIADEVKYANAEKIKVYVRYPTTTWGTTSPNGNSQQKVDIPFSVTAVDNSEYGFYKWAAFSTTGDDGYSTANGRHNIQLIESEAKFEEQYGDKVLGEDEVVFEDPYSPTTIVRVLNNRNDVFIMPICVRRPFLSSTMPSNNQVGAAKNTTIQLVFSNPMDPAFLLFDSAGDPYESNTTDVIDAYLNTSNIFVEQVLSSGENPYNADIIGKLRDSNGTLNTDTDTVKLSASLNKSRKTLTIKLPSDWYWPNGTIMVSVSQTVQDNLGFPMSSDGQVTFNVGNDMDTIPPKVLGLEAGMTTLIDNSQTGVYPRVGKTINIRAVITDQTKENDTASEGNVNTLDYYLCLNGWSVLESGSQTYSPAVNFTEVVSYPKAELTASQRGRGVVFPYTFTNTGSSYDGQYALIVNGVDNVGNPGNIDSNHRIQSTDDVTESESKFIYFIKDTQAPNVNSSQIVATANGNGAPYGWFNSSTISNITIKESSAGTIVDRPSSDGVYGSENVWWTFYMGSDFTTWSNNVKPESDSWSLVSSTGVPLSTLVGSNIDTSALEEGDVLLYAKFRDDVGNISDLVSLDDAIKFDGTNPTLGDLSWTSKNSSVAPGIADSNILVNQQLVVPFTENLSGIKKIKVTVVDPDGDEYATPFADIGLAVRTASSGDPWSGSVDENGDFVFSSDEVSSSSYSSLYIDKLKISDSSTPAEGNYTVKVMLFDAALNATAEKSIELYVDSVNPVITKSYFDGIVNTALTPNRTFTTHSDNNILYIDVTENGSGIQKIALFHCTGSDPYTSGVNYCRNIVTTSGTKLYKSTDDGATFTEVTCSIDTGYVGSEYAYILTIPQNKAIKGTGVLLKITGLTIADPSYKNDCAGAAGLKLYDFAANESAFGDSDKVVGKSIAGIIEDQYSPQVSDGYSIGDSGKRINGSNALVATEGIPAASGYTKTPFVTMVFYVNEYAGNDKVTTCSGLRKIVLDGAIFTPQTEIEFCQNTSVSFNGYANAYYTLKYLDTKSSVEECNFANTVPAGDTSEGGFYIVNGNTAVLRIPASVSQNTPLTIRYAKLSNTASDGEKTVKASFFDTARQLDATASNQKTMTIKYCATKPTITVRTGSVSNPANITAVNITTLVPRNNGLQAYVDTTGTTDVVRVYSWDDKGLRNGARNDPPGTGVRSGSSKRQYFDLDITASSVAALYKFAWSASESASETSVPDGVTWQEVDSGKVDVKIPDVLPLASEDAKYLYLHVADQAGNVTTTRMSNCKWLNASNHGSSEWPWRSSSATSRNIMVAGQYYLEEFGLTNGSSGDPKYRLVMPANASGTKKVYFPTEWFTLATTNGAPIYGCAMGGSSSGGEGHNDIALAKFDENGPYLELPESFYKSSTPNAYFYVYDAVGIDMTAYIVTEVDATPPVLELGVLRDSGEYPSGTSSGMKTKWEGSSYVNSTKTRFNVESDGSRHIRQYVDSTQVSTTKGASETNPIVLYVDTNNPEIMLWTNSMDVLKFTCSVGVAAASEIEIDQTTSTSTDLNTNYVRISPTLTETGALYKFSAVDKGANESSIYIKAYWDNAGPTVSLTNATNIYTNPTDHKNYFASVNEATASTATITITDELVGFGSGEKTLTYNSAKLLDYLTVDTTANTLKLKTTYQADALGNANTASISYNGSSSWTLDNAAPVVSVQEGSMTDCIRIGTTLYFKGSSAKLRLNIVETGSGLHNDSLKNNAEISMSTYKTSDNKIVLSSGVVKDNVGNTDVYTLVNDIIQDASLPVEPASIQSVSTNSGGNSYRDGNTVYFNDSTNSIKLNLSGASDSGGSGLVGYSISGNGVKVTETDSGSVTIEPTGEDFPSSTSIIIYSKDGVGNVSSSGLTVNLVKDADSPEVSIASLVANTGKTYNGNPNYFYYNDNGSYAKVKLSIQDNSGGSGLASSSWGNNTQINISDYLNSSNNTIEITNPVGNVKIVDNVGNTETYSLKYNEKPIIYDADGPDTPTISAIAVTGSGAKYHQDENTIYYNNKTSTITITPSADDNQGGCGVAGYSTSPTGTTSGTIVLNSTIPSYVDIYAIDNLGNASSSYLRVSLVMDDTPPSVSISEITGGKTYPSGSTMFYRDEGMNTVKATLSVLDNVSGVPTSGSYTTGTTLDVSAQLNSDGKIAIENNKVFDNVGNTQAYALMYTVGATSYTFKNDAAPPTAPSGFKVYSTTGGSSSDYYVTGDPDANGFYPSTSKIYYNANVTGITLQFNGSTDTGGSGVKGYAASYSDTIPPTVALDLTASSITVFAFDNVGNKSTSGFTVQYAKDADAPTFEMATPGSSVTSAKAPNGFTVNTYTSGTTQLSFTISDVSGLAAYALVYKEGDGNDYSGYTGPLDWINTTGTSITLTLPDTSHYNTNYMLLLKDKLGNVTKPDGTGTSAYSAAAVKNGSNGWWCSEPATKSFSAGSKIDGNNLEVELNGVDFAVSKIAVTATGVTGISGGKVKFKDTDGSYKDVNCNYSNGTINITDGKYLSYDGSIKFTLTGGEGLAVPTSIKLNGSVEITTIGSLSFFAGFNRFRFGETDATEIRAANTQEAPVRLTRNISVGDFFAAMDSPAYAESDNRVAFSVGKNMDAVVEGKKQEETVTVQEEFGYNNVASDAENLPLQNLSWHAPDGPILEDAGQEEEALALNLSPEFNSSNQVLSASDAGNPQEESHGWNPALVVSLLAMLTLGLVALCVRKRPVR